MDMLGNDVMMIFGSFRGPFCKFSVSCFLCYVQGWQCFANVIINVQFVFYDKYIKWAVI